MSDRRFRMLVLLAALAVAAPTVAAQPPSPADPVVCKRDKSADVGTHMRPAKVCRKKSDWDLAEKNTQNELQALHDRASFNPGRDPAHGGSPH
jgi:hypothetical protein